MPLSLALLAEAFRNLDLLQLPLQLRSLIIVALGGECELQKKALILRANIVCSGPVGRILRGEK